MISPSFIPAITKFRTRNLVQKLDYSNKKINTDGIFDHVTTQNASVEVVACLVHSDQEHYVELWVLDCLSSSLTWYYKVGVLL